MSSQTSFLICACRYIDHRQHWHIDTDFYQIYVIFWKSKDAHFTTYIIGESTKNVYLDSVTDWVLSVNVAVRHVPRSNLSVSGLGATIFVSFLFSLIIWAFKENLKNLASSTSKIFQLTRSDKRDNARKIKIQKTETVSSKSPGLGKCLLAVNTERQWWIELNWHYSEKSKGAFQNPPKRFCRFPKVSKYVQSHKKG
jgi:hypothetical protein